MIEWLIALMMALLSLFFVGEVTEVSGPPDGESFAIPSQALSFTEIESVTVTHAAQNVTLAISGYQPDGCDLPVLVTHEQRGTALSVQIYREMPADVFCTMMLVPYADTLTIEGPFEPALTSISVNSYKIDLK